MGTTIASATQRSSPVLAALSRNGGSAESPLLRALPPQELVALLRRSRGAVGRRGDRIAGPHDDVVTLVIEGVAASRVATASGEHAIQTLVGPGEVHGLTEVLGYRDPARELVAVQATDALALPGQAVRHLVERVPDFARACLDLLARAHAQLLRDRDLVSTGAASERVEHRLLELAERFGTADGRRVIVDLPLTQEELASWARTSRESTAKVLHCLRRAGIVTTGRRQLVIDDLPALRARHDGPTDPTVAAMLRAIG